MIETISQCGPFLALWLQYLPICELARLSRLSSRHRNFIINVFMPQQITLRLGEPDWWTFRSLSWGWIWLERVVCYAGKITFRGDRESLCRFLEIIWSARLDQLQELDLEVQPSSAEAPNLGELPCINLRVLRLRGLRGTESAVPKNGFYDTGDEVSRGIEGIHSSRIRYEIHHPVQRLKVSQLNDLTRLDDLTRESILLPSSLNPLTYERGLGICGCGESLEGINNTDTNGELLLQIHSRWTKSRNRIDRNTSNGLDRSLRTAFLKVFEPDRQTLANILNEKILLEVRAGRANEQIELVCKEDPDLVARPLTLQDFEFLSQWIDYPPLFRRSTSHGCPESEDSLITLPDSWSTDRLCHNSRMEKKWGARCPEAFTFPDERGEIEGDAASSEALEAKSLISPPVEFIHFPLESPQKCSLGSFFCRRHTTYVVSIKVEALEDDDQSLDISADLADGVAHLGAQWVIFEGDLTFCALKAAYRAGILAKRLHGHQVRFLPQTLGYFGPAGSEALLGMIKGEYNEDLWLSITLSTSRTEWHHQRHPSPSLDKFWEGSYVACIKHLSPIPRRYAIKWAAQMLDNVPIEITSQLQGVRRTIPTMSFADAWRCIEGGHWLKLQEFGFFFENIPAYRPF